MRRMPGAAVLIALIIFGRGSALAARQDTANAGAGWTVSQPLTGRAIPCTDGQIKTLKCRNVELLSFLPKSAIGESAGEDLWGWHDSTTGREYVLIGGKATAFVDVTDPVNPKYLGVLPPHEGVTRHGAQSVKVYQHYALIGYEGVNHGMQVVDLSQLRDVKNPPVVFKETAHYAQFANTHTIAINPESGFAYANGTNTCGRGMHIIDVRTPTTPTFAGCYTEPRISGMVGAGYVHDTQCVVYRGPDQQYQGREICISSAGNVIAVADVTDKQRSKTISLASYPNVGFAHQGWLTEDQRYFFLDDEYDEVGGTQGIMPGARIEPKPMRTIVFDMKDLDDPVVLTEFYFPFVGIDHNLYIRGRYMYQGDNERGLQIVDIADPRNPKEAGYLAGMGSAWGTYPFFKNDVVAVSTSDGLVLARLLTR